jgi:hypothetical protein
MPPEYASTPDSATWPDMATSHTSLEEDIKKLVLGNTQAFFVKMER